MVVPRASKAGRIVPCRFTPPSSFIFLPRIKLSIGRTSASVRGRRGFSSSLGFLSGGLASARSPGVWSGLDSGSIFGGCGSGFSGVNGSGGVGRKASSTFGTLSCVPSIFGFSESIDTSGFAANELNLE